MIESVLRHILGAGLAAVTAVMVNSGAVSPLEVDASGWLTVLGAMWAALVPPVIRYLNTKDPAFGRVAGDIAEEVSVKIDKAAEAAKKTSPRAPAKKTGGASGGTAKKTR